VKSRIERLQRIVDIQENMKSQYADGGSQVAQPYQAAELQQLTKQVQAAFGPTLTYMKGMDPYAD
jgi:hypothetical protein